MPFTCHRIELYFQNNAQALGQPPFKVFDDLPPIVTVEQNFDELLIPPDHVSRQPSDTYYVDAQRVLRCHTSAHQTSLLRKGEDRFLVCGDVYRRDEVDSTHYPVFHQMEGVRILTEEEVRRLLLWYMFARELKCSGIVVTLFLPKQLVPYPYPYPP